MKTQNRVIAMAMFAVATFVGNADVTTNRVYSTNQTVGGVEMTPVQQLVYAVTNAPANGVVLIEPGTYTFTGAEYGNLEDSVTNLLYSSKQGVMIIGDTDLSRRDWNDGDEPVIINVNGKGRLFRFTQSNCSVRNLAVTGCTHPGANGFICMGSYGVYPVFTNCVFRNTSGYGQRNAFHNTAYNSRLYDCAYTNNSARLNGDKGVYGCDFIGNTGLFENMDAYGCRFEANSSGGYLDRPLVLSNCSFIANEGGGSGMIQLTSAQATQIADCTFEKNTNTLIRLNLNESVAGSVEVSGCTFSSNVVTKDAQLYSRGAHSLSLMICNTTNGTKVAASSAVWSRFIVKDTIFEGSQFTTEGTRRGMAEVFGVTATGCTFRAFNSSFPHTIGDNTYAMSACNSRLACCDISGGDVSDCVLDRCSLHDVGNPAYACFRDYCRVTNTLVANCGKMLYVANYDNAGGIHDAEFVNCTFANNDALTYRSLYGGDSTNDLKFVNCLFNSNTNGSGKETDISMMNGSTATLNCWISKVSFDHCFYGKFEAYGNLTAESFAAKTNGVDTLSLCVDPKFVKDSRPDAPYWSLLPKSPIIGKGDASIWTAGDVDLAGKLRLKDGRVDPGCYQCWLREPGMTIFVR